MAATVCRHCSREMTPERRPVLQPLDPRTMNRPCPSCRKGMKPELEQCPRCGAQSVPWKSHGGRWWWREQDTQPWQWYDGATDSWHLQAAVDNAPDSTAEPVAAGSLAATPEPRPVLQPLNPRKMNRPCPSCQKGMKPEVEQCPRCGAQSVPWRSHSGRWWWRAQDTQPWQWYDPATDSWHLQAAADNAPDSTAEPIAAGSSAQPSA